MSTNEGYFRVLLPDGRNVNILTTQGADAFLTSDFAAVESAPFITSNIEGANQFRKELARSNSSAQKGILQEKLVQVYVLFGTLADKATPEVFASKVRDEEFQCLISHASDVLTKLSERKQWTKTGVLEKHDQELLETFIPMTKHLRFVKLALQKGLLQILAKLCATRTKPNLPSPHVTETILSIANNVRVTLGLDDWSNEKILKRFEATGILGQAIRFITVPSTHPEALQGHLCILDVLMECPVLVKKKLKPGQPTGDILADVIAGKDGYKGRRDDTVTKRLVNLQRISSMANDKMHDGPLMLGKTCRKCNKGYMTKEDVQKKLMVCSRCKDTFYCSPECQLADWKAHKRVCKPPEKGKSLTAKQSSTMQTTIVSFVMRNYYDIMKEICRVSHEEKVNKTQLILEMDLYAGDQGSAPALRDPPEFKIGVTRRYIEGSRPDEPDWFYKGTDVYRNNVKQFLLGLKDHYNRMTPNHLLTIARYPSGSSGVYRLGLMSEDTERPIFSDEAMDAFSRAQRMDNSRLDNVYGPEQRRYILYRRDMDEKRRRMREMMSRQDDGGAQMQEGMARLFQQTREFMASDRYRELQEEFGDESDGD